MRFLVLILLPLLSLGSLSAQVEKEQSTDSDVFSIVEEMPHLSSCADADDASKCTSAALVTSIGEHLRYPKAARDAKKEGVAFVQFIIDKKGTIQDLKLMRDPGSGLGEAALQAMRQVADELQWQAGKQHGREVPVRMTLPIRFRLN